MKLLRHLTNFSMCKVTFYVSDAIGIMMYRFMTDTEAWLELADLYIGVNE